MKKINSLKWLALTGGLIALPFSILAKTSAITEDVPSYTDRQHATLVSEGVLMADTSPQAYTEEHIVPFSGLYVNVGGDFLINTGEDTVTSTDTNAEATFNLQSNNGGAQANLGYGWNWSGFYLGGELFFDYASMDMNAAEGQGETVGELSSDYDGGLALRVGYVITPKAMLYLLGGVDATKVDIQSAKSAAFSSPSKSKTLLGLMPGIGAEFLFNDSWDLRAQYTYTFYPSFNEEHQDNTGANIKHEYELNRSRFTVLVGYHFPF